MMVVSGKRKARSMIWLQRNKHQTIARMKKIEAIIKPFRLDEVKNALGELGLEEMTVSDVKAFGRQKAHREVYRGTEFQVGFLPEVKIELILQDSRMDAAVAAIIKGSKTARTGSGKVFVSQIDDAIAGHAEAMEEQMA